MIKHFWLYTTLFLFIVFSIIALAVWQSDKTGSFNTSDTLNSSVPLNTSESSSQLTIVANKNKALPALSQKALENYPAPAKQLHKIINNAESKLNADAILDEKIKTLDKKLATLNQQLQLQGVNIPDAQATTVTSKAKVSNKKEPDTQARLQAIKDHINK